MLGRHEEWTPHRRSSDVDDTGRVAPRVPSAEELALIREALRTGKFVGWYEGENEQGEPAPPPKRVVWERDPLPPWNSVRNSALSPEVALMARVAQVRQQRPRERRERRTSRSVGSRGDPSEPDLANTRPPLTRAQRRWLKSEVDRRRRAVIAAGLNVTRAEYDLFSQDRL
jgi:hypothetical protein